MRLRTVAAPNRCGSESLRSVRNSQPETVQNSPRYLFQFKPRLERTGPHTNKAPVLSSSGSGPARCAASRTTRHRHGAAACSTAGLSQPARLGAWKFRHRLGRPAGPARPLGCLDSHVGGPCGEIEICGFRLFEIFDFLHGLSETDSRNPQISKSLEEAAAPVVF